MRLLIASFALVAGTAAAMACPSSVCIEDACPSATCITLAQSCPTLNCTAGIFTNGAPIRVAQNKTDEAAEAKLMLEKAVAAVKADRDVALGQFNRGDFNRAGLSKEEDLYPFCLRLTDDKVIATPSLGTTVGNDARNGTGADAGRIILDALQKVPVGAVTEVHYLWPKPGTAAPALPKTSLVTKVSSDLGCGVGYYK